MRIAHERRRHVGGDLANQLEALLLRPHGERLQRVGDKIGERKRRRLELQPVRLDFREIEDVVEHRQQRLRRVTDGRELVALIRREIAVQNELRHADDAVHRRQDLVAHVGEEFALGAARLHRPIARPDELLVDAPQLRGARVDGAFEVQLLQLQLPIAPVDLVHHLVDAGDQLPQLIVARRVPAKVIAVLVGHRTRESGQILDRPRDHPLEPHRQREGDPERREQDDGQNARERDRTRPCPIGVRGHPQRGDRGAAIHHGMRDTKRAREQRQGD